MWVYSNHKISFQFSLCVEEMSKMQACKTFSSMHGQAWHFIYKKTIRKGSNMYKNHLRRQRSVWVTLNPNPAAANPCPRPPFTTLLLALLFLETMLPRKSRWLGIVYIQVLYSNEHCTYSSWVWIYNLKGLWMFFVCLLVWSGVQETLLASLRQCSLENLVYIQVIYNDEQRICK